MRFFLASWQFYKDVAPHLELEYQLQNQEWKPFFKKARYHWIHLFFNPHIIFNMLVKRKLEDLAVHIEQSEAEDIPVNEFKDLVKETHPNAIALRVLALQNSETHILLEAQLDT